MKVTPLAPRAIEAVPIPLNGPELSFVIPAFNEADNIVEVILQVDREAKAHAGSHEIIVVDDGSQDETFERAQNIAGRVPLRLIRLSRNFGKEQAIMAGFEASTGADVVVLDADLQDPLRHLATMLRHRAEGFEVVYGVRTDRADEPYAKQLLVRWFYSLLNLDTETNIPANARDFRVMDRRVVDAICSLPERNRFMKGLYGWVGFRSKAIPIKLDHRKSGVSKFGFRGLVKLGLTGLTSFTNWPLRVWTLIGMCIASVSIFYGIWIAAKTIIFGIDVPGWSTLIVAILLLGGLQLISIGILGEYLARVFTEVKGRPGFIIAETHDRTGGQK